MLPRNFLKTHFEFSDKFSDANDLRQSWTKTPVPEVVLRFFRVLFNFNPKLFYDSNTSNEAIFEKNDEDEDNIDRENDLGMSDNKRRKMRALHQIMFFNVHNGSNRTPLIF